MDQDDMAVKIQNYIEELVIRYGYTREEIDSLVDDAFDNAN